MANEYVNKVTLSNGDTLIDLTGDTVTQAAHIVAGFIGHLASGEVVTGTGSGPYADGDNEAYGSEGILGTWYFNSSLDLSSISRTSGTGSLIFTSNNTSYTVFVVSNPLVIYGSDTVYFLGWENEAYRTITITGGTYTTDSEFIAWLESNATKQ